MTVPHRVSMIEFDEDHHAHAVFVRKDVEPRVLLSLLDLTPLPQGIISISGGATDFPPEIVDRTIELFETVIVPLAYEYNLLIIDGGTDAGVMKIIGEVFGRNRYKPPIIIGGDVATMDEFDSYSPRPPLVGFVPRAKVFCPGVARSSRNAVQLDPNHTHFVMVLYAKNWGAEVECMFSFVDYLATHEKIPVINVVANGGRITIKETYHAVQQRWPIIVLEGSKRATQMIISALDGASEKVLIRDLRRFELIKKNSELRETLRWLTGIVEYNKITRFDFITHPPDELRHIILSRLGFI